MIFLNSAISGQSLNLAVMADNNEAIEHAITAKTSLGIFRSFKEGVRVLTFRKKKWTKVNVTYLEVGGSSNVNQEVFVREKAVSKLLGLRRRDIRMLKKEEKLECLINRRCEPAQRLLNQGFSNRELFLSGLEGGVYREILEATDSKKNNLPVQPNAEGKVYYNSYTKTWTNSKVGINKRQWITVQYENDAVKQIKVNFLGASGASKNVFFRPQLTDGKLIVKCKESIKPLRKAAGHYMTEREVYERFLGNPYFTQCLLIKDKNEVDKVDRSFYMEYSGLTLLEEYKNLSKQERLSVLRDIFLGLKDLHEAGYVHFDLHPANYFVMRENENVCGKLADFGNTRKIDHLQDPGSFFKATVGRCGWTANFGAYTPEFIAYWIKAPDLANCFSAIPQKIQDFNYTVTGKNDIYHMAVQLCLLYYDISDNDFLFQNGADKYPAFLRPHFYAAQLHKGRVSDLSGPNLINLFNILNVETEAPSDKDSLDYLLWSMLRPNPNDRPTAGEVADTLDLILKSSP